MGRNPEVITSRSNNGRVRQVELNIGVKELRGYKRKGLTFFSDVKTHQVTFLTPLEADAIKYETPSQLENSTETQPNYDVKELKEIADQGLASYSDISTKRVEFAPPDEIDTAPVPITLTPGVMHIIHSKPLDNSVKGFKVIVLDDKIRRKEERKRQSRIAKAEKEARADANKGIFRGLRYGTWFNGFSPRQQPVPARVRAR